MNSINKLITGEDILIKIKTKSDLGFWQYQLLGLLSLYAKGGNDYFIITNKKILICIKENIKANFSYDDFSKITFNTKSDLLSFMNENNEMQQLSLSEFKLEYDDYQYLKHQLNN